MTTGVGQFDVDAWQKTAGVGRDVLEARITILCDAVRTASKAIVVCGEQDKENAEAAIAQLRAEFEAERTKRLDELAELADISLANAQERDDANVALAKAELERDTAIANREWVVMAFDVARGLLKTMRERVERAELAAQTSWADVAQAGAAAGQTEDEYPLKAILRALGERDSLRAKLAACVKALESISAGECAVDHDAAAVDCPKLVASRALFAAKGGV